MAIDPHQPLRDDVRLLGELLGDTIRTQEGDQLFQTVERVRALAKSARAGNDTNFRVLSDELSRMPSDEALPIARAFAQFLHLANIAEQHHRVRRRRAYQRDPSAPPQRGSCDDAFARVMASGITGDRLYEAVCGLRIELVLTAHPTEVVRRRVAQKHNRIAALLSTRDRSDMTLLERDDVLAALRREVEGAWATSEVREQRPTPLDEVRSGLVVFEQSLWQAVPQFLRGVDRALRKSTGRGLPLDAAPIRFGSWMGGDRDGNPSVTADVTRRACLLSRWVAADRYLRDIDAVRDELSMEMASPELRARLDADTSAPEADTSSPYRELLRIVRTRMLATRRWIETSLEAQNPPPPDADVYVEADDFLADLRLCHRSLEDTGHARIASGPLTDLIRRVAVFDVTLARIDVRQDSARHADALTEITAALGLGAYNEWDEHARLDFLTRELAGKRPLIPPDLDASAETRDVLDTLAMIANAPRGSLGAYVITMARSASDVLAVELLQKEARVAAPLRVVPLFETSRDLHHAGSVIDALLGVPWYRARIGGRQEVMIGYSDSAKDVGRVSAGWDLYRAQEDVIAASHAHGVAVTLFHGRGGSVGRGGGPTHLAIQSQPPGSIDGTLRVTEQGEQLQALFGFAEIAVRTLEVYTTGTLEAWLVPARAALPEWRACMDRLSSDAASTYRRIVYETPEFLDYFHTSTPESDIGALNIGSRPARRGGASDVGGLRAIPWQFAWTQTRLMLGAWLGIEDALACAVERGDRDLVMRMYREWPHFQSEINLIEMVLAKADGRIAGEYDRRLVPPSLQPLGVELRDRLTRAMRGVLDLTSHRELLEATPVIRRSIDVRNPYVDPLNLVQIELLRRLREHDDPRARAALMVTVNGIAAGMRNTG